MAKTSAPPVVLFDAACNLLNIFRNAGCRVAATAPPDRAGFGPTWPAAIADALGAAPDKPIVVVVLAADADAFEPARHFLEQRPGQTCVLVEVATTAGAEESLDARQRLVRADLEELTQLVLHCSTDSDRVHAGVTKLAWLLGVRDALSSTMSAAASVTESGTCHAVVLRSVAALDA